MAEAADLVLTLEKAVHNVLSTAQGAARDPVHGQKVTALLYEAADGMRMAVDGVRGVPGGPRPDSIGPALRRIRQAIDGLRPHLPRGSNGGEQLALARWLCDSALSAVGSRGSYLQI